MIEVELETLQLSLQIDGVPKENVVKKFAPYASNQPLREGEFRSFQRCKIPSAISTAHPR
jgi:hypothetical protein